MCDCENCKYNHTFKAFYDEWKGMQYDSECTASLEEMPKECAEEMGYEKEWLEDHDKTKKKGDTSFFSSLKGGTNIWAHN